MDVYEAAKQFDHTYDNFRIDALPSLKKLVKVTFYFYTGNAAKDVCRTATKEVHTGLAHQIRPYGSCRLVEDATTSHYEIIIHFDERKITDVGTTILLSKLVRIAEDLVERYGFK